jgi:hypothetical protein
MPEILNLLASLPLGNINRENLPKRVKRKAATLTVADKETKQTTTTTTTKLFNRLVQ